MTWTLVWSWVAEHRDFRALHWHAAERIDAALIQLAATSRGPITRVKPDDPNTFRLRVKGAEAHLFIDRNARVIYVVRVHGRR